MGSLVDPSLAGFLFTSAALIGCGNLRSGGMARLINLDAPPQVSTPLQGLARNCRRLDVDARAPCDPASRCHAWSHPRGLDDADDHPGALFAGHTRAECDRLWHPPEGGCCRWCDWQPSGSRVCRTDRRTKQRLPCPCNDGRPFRDHSADVKPICYGVRTLERDDHSSALERCYRIVLPTSQSGRFAWPGGFSLSFLRLGPDGSCGACRGWIVSIVTCSLRAEMAMRMPYFIVAAASVGLFLYGLSRLRF